MINAITHHPSAEHSPDGKWVLLPGRPRVEENPYAAKKRKLGIYYHWILAEVYISVEECLWIII